MWGPSVWFLRKGRAFPDWQRVERVEREVVSVFPVTVGDGHVIMDDGRAYRCPFSDSVVPGEQLIAVSMTSGETWVERLYRER